MFKECLKNNIMPFIIDDEHKLFYYRGLREYDNIKGYLVDTCLSCQDKYQEILNEYLDDLAEGIANFIMINDVDMLVIGGSIAWFGDKFYYILRAKIANLLFNRDERDVRMKFAKLGNDAGLIGAAFLPDPENYSLEFITIAKIVLFKIASVLDSANSKIQDNGAWADNHFTFIVRKWSRRLDKQMSRLGGNV